MGRLIQNSLQAERLHSCIFAETFESCQAVVKNVGTIVGSMRITSGAYFDDNAANHIRYNSFPQFMGEISIVVKFTADFVLGDGNKRNLFDADTTVGNNFIFTVNSDGTLRVNMLATFMYNFPLASYQDYWDSEGENTLVLTRNAVGYCECILNGMVIHTGTIGGAWEYINYLKVGEDAYWTDAPWKGWINSIKFFSKAITTSEAIDYCSNSTFNYRGKAVVDLQFRNQDHDIAGVRTLDSSSRGNHATIHGGVTKDEKHGYSFDGVDGYLDVGNIGSVNSISFMFNPTTDTEDIMDMDGGTHTVEIAAGTLTATGFVAPQIYINGIVSTAIQAGQWQTITIVTATAFNASAFKIGRETTYFEGGIKNVMASGLEITSLQAIDTDLFLKKSINEL